MDIENQILEIQRKLDLLLSRQPLPIQEEPRRNVRELKQWAEKTAARIRDKQRGREKNQ